MKYVSTRGAAPMLGFGDVLLTGLAPDGGLYVPESVPTWSLAERRAVLSGGRDRSDVALRRGLDDRAELRGHGRRGLRHVRPPGRVPGRRARRRVCACRSCGTARRSPSRTSPCSSSAGCSTHELTKRGERATIVVATSGDTGSAAIAACVGRANLDIVVLHPAGRVSDVQRRQMTTVDEPNVHNVAIDGTFDDCQDLVKAMFADEVFR